MTSEQCPFIYIIRSMLCPVAAAPRRIVLHKSVVAVSNFLEAGQKKINCQIKADREKKGRNGLCIIFNLRCRGAHEFSNPI